MTAKRVVRLAATGVADAPPVIPQPLGMVPGGRSAVGEDAQDDKDECRAPLPGAPDVVGASTDNRGLSP
jgi:hypothetical protein